MKENHQSQNTLPERGQIIGPLPTMKELHNMHVDSLVEEQAEMAEEVGYFKKLLREYPVRPELGEGHIGNCIHNTLKSLIELRKREYWKIDNTIDSETQGQKS